MGDKMKKSRQLTGLRIVDLKYGKIIGKIDGVVFYPRHKKILGFRVNCGKWVKKHKALPVREIVSIGTDSITVRSDNALAEYGINPEFLEAEKEKNRIFGLAVMANTGEELGYIEDIIIDENKCTIEGYVLTDGIIDDILNGKSIIPYAQEMIFGEEVIIIVSDYKNVVMRNEFKLKKVLKNGGRFRH